MREKSRAFVVAGGTVVSLYFALMIASMIIAGVMKVSHPLEGSSIAILTLLGSPLALALAVYSAWLSRRLGVRPWLKGVLLTVNGLGCIVTGMFVAGLAALWMMGPINPG